MLLSVFLKYYSYSKHLRVHKVFIQYWRG